MHPIKLQLPLAGIVMLLCCLPTPAEAEGIGIVSWRCDKHGSQIVVHGDIRNTSASVQDPAVIAIFKSEKQEDGKEVMVAQGKGRPILSPIPPEGNSQVELLAKYRRDINICDLILQDPISGAILARDNHPLNHNWLDKLWDWLGDCVEVALRYIAPLGVTLLAAAGVMWYTIQLKVSDLTMHCFSMYRDLDAQHQDLRNYTYHWWGHQHLQFAFWRRGLLTNATFHHWMLRRRLEHWEGKHVRPTEGGLHNWDAEKGKYSASHFGYFMEEILTKDIDLSPGSTSLWLKNESEIVKAIMKRYRTIFNRFLSLFLWVGREMAIPDESLMLRAKIVNKKLFIWQPGSYPAGPLHRTSQLNDDAGEGPWA